MVIVNYRTPIMTAECVASLEREHHDSGAHVVLVDNGSEDESAEVLEKTVQARGWGGWVQVFRSSCNRGFAAGNNIGINSVRADAYILLNSDTLVRPGAISKLIEAMHAEPAAGLIGPQIRGADDALQCSAFRNPTPVTELLLAAGTGVLDRLLRRHIPSLKPDEIQREAEWLSFAAVLIRREVIEQIGLLDEGYFMYFEDVDYCRRARAAGWGIHYCPEACVIHLQGQSSAVPRTIAERKRLPRYYYAARARYYRKWYGLPGLLSANVLWTIGHGISLVRRLVHGRQDHAARRQFFDNWIGAFDRGATANVGERS